MSTLNKKPKVALMSYAMDNRVGKGIGIYTRKLIEGLLEDDRFDFYLVHYEKVDDPLYRKAKEIIMPKIKLPYGSRFLSQLLFFWKYRKENFDIVHWFHPRIYPFYSLVPAKKVVVTAHGAGDITAPQHFVFSRSVFNFVLKYFHRRVDAIIGDSDFGREEIIEYYSFTPDRVKSIYLGGGENFRPMDRSEVRKVVAEKYAVVEPFILNVSRLQPHKNVVSLIQAYSLMRIKNEKRKEKLVIVAKSAYENKRDEYDAAEQSPFSKDIVFIDFIAHDDLNEILSAAELFVFPSLNEGFGLPVLEAMASGTPVVTSTVTSLPEVAGEAGITVDPLDIEAIANAMNKVLEDKGLASAMVEAGFIQASKFTWQKTIDQTKKLYLDLLLK